jgi:membrane-bound serine protease (ClpP class)
MRGFRRYLLLQVPGWVLAAVILHTLHGSFALPRWLAVSLLVAYIGKDLLLFPFLRRAYETGEEPGANRLVGLRATVEQDINPEGYVRVRGELWRAQVRPGRAPISSGARVRIVSGQGLTLTVEPAASENEPLAP